MRRRRRLRLRPIARPSRLQRAPLWRRFAAGTVDGALEFGCYFAVRMLANRAASHETATSLAEQARTALKELLEPSPRGDEAALPEAPQELLESPKKLIEAAGRGGYWTTERVVSWLASGLGVRAGPIILTGGQTPGQKLLGVRVTSMDGQPITARQALVREFGYRAFNASLDLWPLPHAARGAARLALWGFGPAVRLLDSDRRSVDDVLAGTRVIRATGRRRRRL